MLVSSCAPRAPLRLARLPPAWHRIFSLEPVFPTGASRTLWRHIGCSSQPPPPATADSVSLSQSLRWPRLGRRPAPRLPSRRARVHTPSPEPDLLCLSPSPQRLSMTARSSLPRSASLWLLPWSGLCRLLAWRLGACLARQLPPCPPPGPSLAAGDSRLSGLPRLLPWSLIIFINPPNQSLPPPLPADSASPKGLAGLWLAPLECAALQSPVSRSFRLTAV
jgi:hypothetical protein